MSKYFFGTRKSDNANIYLTMPTWDCGWYWSWGCLGNTKEHYQLSSYQQKDKCIKDENGKIHLITEKRNKNMYDCLLEDYTLSDKLKNNLWKFCELSVTIYTLKETAEVLHRGGSHYTNNPCKDTIKNSAEVDRINTVVLPSLFEEIKSIFEN